MLTYQLCWLWQRADSLLKKWSYWPKPCVEFPCLFNFFNTTCQFQKTFKENTCLFKKKKILSRKSQVSNYGMKHSPVLIYQVLTDLLQLLTKLQPQGCKSAYSSLIDHIYHDWLHLWTMSIPVNYYTTQI